METIEEVWAGDLFNRQSEAVDLIGYLESVAGRPAIREDGHAHVMAIDTAYGHGKTFFLKRLDRHLRTTEHVSAYVDAWMDDLEDQPMVALAATLDKALQPWAQKSRDVASGLNQFKNRAGTVAKIVGVGLVKRGAGFLITQGAVEALGDELALASEMTRDIAKDALKDGGKAAVDDISNALKPSAAPSMEVRIDRFREGQAAIQAMKDSLSFVVQALVDAGMKLPITIIVDELDRCRPTYAIKVLEEIKHLFDVSGVAFLLGLHGKQLSHSVNAAYGQNFDSAAYLRRFFSRRYSLKPVSLQPLVEHLMDQLSIDERLLNHPAIVRKGAGRPVELPKAELISDYITAYGLAARDAFGVLEGLRTAMALTRGYNVQLMYLLPLILSQHVGKAEVDGFEESPRWSLALSSDPFGRDISEYNAKSFVEQLNIKAQLNDSELSEEANNSSLYARIILEGGFRNGSSSYHLLQNYIPLVQAVGRFS